jgi:uncharacterized RDD family membrane protein YckC
MSWYYADAGRQIGPVSKTDLDSLFHSGAITQNTLVWTEGMADWQTYGDSGAMDQSSGASTTVPEPLAACSECGQAFPAGEVVRYGNSAVCAGCKPLFLQKLREGTPPSAGLIYAGFWIRAAALLIDLIILMVVNFMVATLLLVLAGEGPEAQLIAQVIAFLIQVAIGMAYEVGFLGRFGATPGKMACGLKVLTAEGEPISYGRAFGRYFGKILSWLVLGIGYLMAAFDDQKRTLHDRICHTRVVKFQ